MAGKKSKSQGKGKGKSAAAGAEKTMEKPATHFFINPYTFIPIEDTEPKRTAADVTEKVSGKITCLLEVQSSTFIPNTTKKFRYLQDSRDYTKEHFFQEFFSYENLEDRGDSKNHNIPEEPPKFPRIPGSELRGMIRNIYEQLTNSCLSVIDEENLPSIRTSVPKKAAIWDRSTNQLYEAERVMLNTTSGHPKGKYVNPARLNNTTFPGYPRVWIKKSADSYGGHVASRFVDDISGSPTATCKTEGFVLFGESFPRKHHNSVLIKSNQIIANITDLDQSRFQAVLDKYAETKARGHRGYSEYRKIYSNPQKYQNLPVFYSKVSDHGKTYLYLSPAMIGKEVFENTISDLLEKNHNNHQPCTGEKGKWCPACRLFGMVSKTRSNALASGLRFTDSEVFEDFEFDNPRVLPILGAPRCSSVEFYLEKPAQANFWNYDYKKNGNNVSPYPAKLRGRKVYWLGKNRFKDMGDTCKRVLDEVRNEPQNTAEKDSVFNTKRLKMTSSVRTLKTGKTKFSIYFENISKEELVLLLHCLNLREEHLHRIGRGKPYGMGAVKLKVEKIEQRSYQMDEHGEISAVNEERAGKDFSLDTLPEKELYVARYGLIRKYLTKLPELQGNLVAYPSNVGDERIFTWFASNRGNFNNASIIQTLPKIDEDDQTLKKY